MLPGLARMLHDGLSRYRPRIGWLLWSVWSVSFIWVVWLNETNQINQIDQMNQKGASRARASESNLILR